MCSVHLGLSKENHNKKVFPTCYVGRVLIILQINNNATTEWKGQNIWLMTMLKISMQNIKPNNAIFSTSQTSTEKSRCCIKKIEIKFIGIVVHFVVLSFFRFWSFYSHSDTINVYRIKAAKYLLHVLFCFHHFPLYCCDCFRSFSLLKDWLKRIKFIFILIKING